MSKVNKKSSLIKSFSYAFKGIKEAIKLERNVKIHFMMMIVVIICGFIFSISLMEWIICLLLFGLVISLELVNTAIETVVDLCMPEIHPMAKLAKDVAAGAVMISSVVAVIIGLMIFIPKLIE